MVGNVGVAAILLGNRNWPALGTLLVVGSGVISSTAQIARLEHGVASENGSQSTLAAGGRKSSGSHGGSRPRAAADDRPLSGKAPRPRGSKLAPTPLADRTWHHRRMQVIPHMDPAAWAAWIQAIFSVVAIAATAWVVKRQHELERERDAERDRLAAVARMNAALLVSSLQFNRLTNFRDQTLSQHEDDSTRHVAIQPSASLGRELALDFTPLAGFAIDGDTEAMVSWAMSDAKYGAAITAIEARSEAHREFQRVAERAVTGDFFLADLEAAIGPRLTMTLRRGTDQMYDAVADALASLSVVGQSIPAALKKVYPDQRFIGFGTAPQTKR